MLPRLSRKPKMGIHSVNTHTPSLIPACPVHPIQGSCRDKLAHQLRVARGGVLQNRVPQMREREEVTPSRNWGLVGDPGGSATAPHPSHPRTLACFQGGGCPLGGWGLLAGQRSLLLISGSRLTSGTRQYC